MEEWRQLRKYPNYSVSNKGRIKSFKYNKERMLKQFFNISKGQKRKQPKRYLKVMLCVDGKPINRYVHRLVFEGFKGDIPKTHQVDHINGNTLDNNTENLRLLTIKENTGKKGDKNIKAKLAEIEVLEIREIGRKKTLKEISKIYNVSCGTISHILTRRTWRHV